MSDPFNFFCNEVLTSIEIQEAQLLNWGFISGTLDLRTQMPHILGNLPKHLQTLWETQQKKGLTPDDVLDNLVKRKLVMRLDDGSYRSRFAETVRLLYLLRQRFSEKDWHTARNLVSDLKVQPQRRRYPRRNIPLGQLEEQLSNIDLSGQQIDTIKQLLQDENDSHFELARFQHDAILRQLNILTSNQDRALVIGAGTGAGKTKAFYIPALAHIAENLNPSRPYLQVLAIYPRIELLKDQLAEAFAEVGKLTDLLQAHGKRPISIGAYFGGTPESAKDLLKNPKRYGWLKSADGLGYHCPFFTCPNDANHDLLWEIDDIVSGHPRLRCQSCSFETDPEQLILTREQLRSAPPDILFTSTEMLNRRMSRASEHALLGIDQAQPPRLVLLDEIHTYEGIHGAQVAYLLRRWRHARGYHPQQNLCIVGLSATLTQATDFFAKLTGISSHHVDYVHPREDDLIEEGMEYNLVLKGDPVSGVALLSASVQTAMLLGRILDPIDSPLSEGAYGQRIFAFTDKLDVINRWRYIMDDAERAKTLSQWRDPDCPGPLDKRRAQGQVWDICKLLTYDLHQPLNISRTTSQDPGVDQNADLVVATSTLEVGYNDPTVGAVIQHKAPRSMASFLQRKGRAGRIRGMRPWTVVITSAYGRDRWAFQHAETLFAPYLPPIDLPIENYYVRKIQAAYALMDWLAQQLKTVDQTIDVWQLLSTGNNYQRSSRLAKPRSHLHNLLIQLLQNQRRADFETYLQNALGLSGDSSDLHAILWGEPRPLYLEVIPTLIRQLETNWRKITPENKQDKEQEWKDHTAGQPLPDFIPAALFTDLNLPEVQIRLPEREKKNSAESDPYEKSLPLAQTLTEFAPGKANKRFVLTYRKDVAHWLALPDEAQLTRGVANLDLLGIEADPLTRIVIDQATYTIFRPRIYQLSDIPEDIRSSSAAQLIWHSHFMPNRYGSQPNEKWNTANTITLPPQSSWRRFFEQIRIYTHANGNWVDVTRFAIGVETDTRYKNGHRHQRTLYFEKDDTNAAIGFTVSADALQLTINTLDLDHLRTLPTWPRLYRHFAPEFFRHKLHTDKRLKEAGLSSFAIDWLWQLELSMLTATAVAQQCTLAEAAQTVKRTRHALADRTLQAIFQSQRSEDDDVDERGRLHEDLLHYMEDSNICAALGETAIVLWNDQDRDLPSWLEQTYLTSVGATLFATITRLVPDIDPDELIMDVDKHNVWITEVASGGVGLIAKIADTIAQHPRDLELQLLDTVQYCEREQLAHHLRAVTSLIAHHNNDLETAFHTARSKTDLPSLSQTHQLLSETLEAHGIPATRQLIVALNTKFLRPNSDADSDALITSMVEQWDQEAARLGIAIDLRVMAVAARRIPSIEQQVQQVLQRIGGGQPTTDESQIFNLLQSLLWLDCHDSCPDCIERWHPYQQLGHSSRALLNMLLEPDIERIAFQSAYWESKIRDELADVYQVQISCQPEQFKACKHALSHFLTTPIDIGYQRFYPVVERIIQHGQQWSIQLTVKELVGG